MISRDGAVVGDSRVPFEKLAGIENHAGRPEIRDALAGRVSRSERRSQTIGVRLLYVAIPVAGGSGGVVRVALDIAGLDAAVAELRRQLLAAGAIAVLGALALAYGIARYAQRPLREIRRLASAVAAGDLDHPIPRRSGEELGEISNAIRRLAEQLRERLDVATSEKERLRTVLDAMVEGVLVVNPELEIVLANQRLCDFFGVGGDLLGRTPLEALRNADLAQLFADAQQSAEPLARALSVAHPVRRTLRVHAVRFPPGGGPALGTVAVLHDVTEMAQLERMRREFVANASHELRTPLAAIRGFAETLLGNDQLADEDRRSYLEVIDRNAQRLGNLVGDLLELSRIEGGDVRLDLAAIDVAAVAEAVIRDASPRFQEKGLQLSCEAQGDVVAWADAQALEQIFTNLLDNALKYTDAGGSVAVRIEGDEHGVRVRVSDSGTGIPEAALGRIFERFYRVDTARSRALGGTGLGLAIVKHLVVELGGEIHVDSELAKGSTFRFTLPKQR